MFTDVVDSIEELSRFLVNTIPQKPPFRFLDKILEIDDLHICGEYRFREDEWFYQGHFPGQPTTPGVILIEAMAQTGVVAFGLYKLIMENKNNPAFNPLECLSLFTDVEAEFLRRVSPGDTIIMKGETVFWRKRKLKTKVSLYLSSGDLAAVATLSGMGVIK